VSSGIFTGEWPVTERKRPMHQLLVEPFGDVALSAIASPTPAALQASEVDVVSRGPDWIELRIPGDLKAVSASEEILGLAEACIPREARDAIAFAFRELLANAIEHGCRLDKSKYVEVSFVRLERAFVCGIRDCGEGFDPSRLAHAAINNSDDEPMRHSWVREELGMRAGGYGLLLTGTMVDELIYNERHNEVVFVKYLS